MAVRADQDRVVARRGAGRDAAADLGDDPVGLVRCPVAKASSRTGAGGGDRRARRGGACDAGPDLEPVGVVEPDQPVGGVEDRRLRAVVPAQDDGPGRAVAVAEAEDVVDRGAAERVDRLVVVARRP